MCMVFLLKQVLRKLAAIYNAYRIIPFLCFVLKERTQFILNDKQEIERNRNEYAQRHMFLPFFQRVSCNSTISTTYQLRCRIKTHGHTYVNTHKKRQKSNKEIFFSVTESKILSLSPVLSDFCHVSQVHPPIYIGKDLPIRRTQVSPPISPEMGIMIHFTLILKFNDIHYICQYRTQYMVQFPSSLIISMLTRDSI